MSETLRCKTQGKVNKLTPIDPPEKGGFLYEVIMAYMTLEEIKDKLQKMTIFDKIEFSGISKADIAAKLNDLKTRQVPQRDVLLDMQDVDVVFYWFKNWLHPKLKNFVPKPNLTDMQGVSAKCKKRLLEQHTLWFYENGQQNFEYTLTDVENYIK